MSNLEAIDKINGICVILAGAGTGKTYTIVEKVKKIIESGVEPEKIVCITFSNEAANNLKLRINKFIEGKNEPVIRTFHGFSADLLRMHGEKIGISREFKILDPDQAKVILHRSLRINVANCHKYIGTIGTAKDLGIKLEDFQNFIEQKNTEFSGVNLEGKLEALNFELQTLHLKKDWNKKKDLLRDIKKIKKVIEMRKFVNAWNAYEKIKKKGDYQDYSDLNVNALKLLNENPEIAEKYEYVIVDEFQDTNKLQLDFLVKLAINGNITIVGDMNQSIYRFRGAYKDNFNIFKKVFDVKDIDVFNLAKSYRSSDKILRIAHKMVLNNYENKEDCFFVENAHNRAGEKVEVYEMKSAGEEARKIVELVNREKDKGIALEDMCIMFRAHQYGRIIKKALENAGINYSSVSKASLLKQKSVKTTRDYLIVLNKLKKKEKGGEDVWWDLVYQLDFSREDLIKIGKAIKDFIGNNRDKKEEDENKLPISVHLFTNLENIVSEKGKMAAKILTDKLKLLISENDKSIGEMIKEVYKISGLVNEQKTREEKEIMINLNKFYELAKLHEELYDSDLDSFLYYLDILESLGIEIPASELEEKGVRLMTSHSTKGLEYNVVIVSNLAQGRFPVERYVGNSLLPTELLPEVKDDLSEMSEEDKEEFIKNYEKHNQLLEERRLAYVSFTRAKDKLILTYAKEYSGKESLASMFLNEIDYKKNEDIDFYIDNDTRYVDVEKDFDKKTGINEFISAEQLEMKNDEDGGEKKEKKKLSPSALILFDECQKRFEYKYVYNMPDKKTMSWEAMRLGSFVHLILEKGVRSGFSNVDDFLNLAKEMSMDEDWESLELNEAETLIKVFFERNKDRYNEKSRTEQYLPLQLEGIDFIGFADRIDFTNGGVEIVDYKTGKTNINPRDRNWQLGFYALAAQEKYVKEGKVRKVILDMLKQEKPLEFEIDEFGNAKCLSSKYIEGFNINDIKRELIETAKKIQQAQERGFEPCSIEKNCEFCNEYVYGL